MKTDTRLLILIDHTFSGFTGVITHAGCRENTKKACESLAFGSSFTSLRVFFIFLLVFECIVHGLTTMCYPSLSELEKPL